MTETEIITEIINIIEDKTGGVVLEDTLTAAIEIEFEVEAQVVRRILSDSGCFVRKNGGWTIRRDRSGKPVGKAIEFKPSISASSFSNGQRIQVKRNGGLITVEGCVIGVDGRIVAIQLDSGEIVKYQAS